MTSAAYARDYNEIKRLGGDGVTTPTSRTPKQTETALFWVESSPLSWNRLARSIALRGRLDVWEQARLFGLLNIALADGYISSFAQKYAQEFWRPITAIRLGDTDGNKRTTADPGWTPLLTTPPVPDHDSAHAVEGGAAAMVLRGCSGPIGSALPVQPDRRGREVRGPEPGGPPVHAILAGGNGERRVPGLCRLPLPVGGRAGSTAR